MCKKIKRKVLYFLKTASEFLFHTVIMPLKMYIKVNFARFMNNDLDKHGTTVSRIIFKRMSLHI